MLSILQIFSINTKIQIEKEYNILVIRKFIFDILNLRHFCRHSVLIDRLELQ